jgi:hypothetical protein
MVVDIKTRAFHAFNHQTDRPCSPFSTLFDRMIVPLPALATVGPHKQQEKTPIECVGVATYPVMG